MTDPSKVLLHASITAADRQHYSVAFSGDGCSEDVYVRLALHYYARVLYELRHAGHSTAGLPTMIDRIASSDSLKANIFSAAGVRAFIEPSVGNAVGEVKLELSRSGVRQFRLGGTVNLTGRALVCSVLALLHALSSRLSPDTMWTLISGLANMNASYALSHHYADPESLHEVPELAYKAAAFSNWNGSAEA
ncbi:MAG TPA: hypothetical protein VF824_08645 [Thermoanaerobaculia bacterium]|jgi:hypothetical protein